MKGGHKIQLVICYRDSYIEYEVRIDGKPQYVTKDRTDASGVFLEWYNNGFKKEEVMDEREVRIVIS